MFYDVHVKKNFCENIICEYFSEFLAGSFDKRSEKKTELAISTTTSFRIRKR